MDEDSVIISDEDLEGDVGSDFDIDDDFPSEWMVVDDADEELVVIDTEDKSAKTKKNYSSVKKQDTLLKSGGDKASTDRKKDDGRSKSNRDDEKKQEKSQDKKSKDSNHHSRSRSRDRKVDSHSKDRKHDSPDKSEAGTSTKKDSSEKSTSKSIHSHDSVSKSTNVKDATKKSPSKSTDSSSQLTEKKEVEKNPDIKSDQKEVKQEPNNIETLEHPLPKMSSNLGEDFNIFNIVKQSARCCLVTGGADDPPTVTPFNKKKSLKWGMRLYPFFGMDLTLKEMEKIVNIADNFGVFVLSGKLPKCGDMSLMTYHHNDLKTILVKIYSMELQSLDVNIFINRRRVDNTFETGELKLNLKECQLLDTNLSSRTGSFGEGRPESRSIKVQNIPEGTSKEMMEVLFPISNKITFCQLSKGDKTGSATVEFISPANAKQLTTSYSVVKLGDNTLTLTFTGLAEDKKKGEEKKKAEEKKKIEEKKKNDKKKADERKNKDYKKKPEEKKKSEDKKSDVKKPDLKQPLKRTNEISYANRKRTFSDRTAPKRDERRLDSQRQSRSSSDLRHTSNQQDQIRRLRERSRQILINRDFPDRPQQQSGLNRNQNISVLVQQRQRQQQKTVEQMKMSLQQRQRQQQKEVEQMKMSLQQQNVMSDQQTAMMQSNMMRPSEAPGILGPPGPLEMEDLLPELPEGLVLGEKQRLMVIEQQKRHLLQQQMQQQQQILKQQQQILQQHQVQQQPGSDNAWKQFQKPIGNPNDDLGQGNDFRPRGNGILGEMPRQQAGNMDMWPEEPKIIPSFNQKVNDHLGFDQKDVDRRGFDDQFSIQEQMFGQMMKEDQQNFLLGQKQPDSQFDRSDFRDDVEFDNKGRRGRNAMEQRKSSSGPGNRFSVQQQQSQFGILPTSIQNAGNPYVLPTSSTGRRDNPDQEDMDWNIGGRNKPDPNVFSQDRMRDRDRSSLDRSNRDVSNLEMLAHRDDIMSNRDMVAAKRGPGGEMHDGNRLQREMMGVDITGQNMKGWNSQDTPGQDRTGRDMQGNGYGGRHSDKIQPSRIHQSDFGQQRHEFNEPSYSDTGSGMFGNVLEYGHGNKPNKRQNQFEPDEPIPVKRGMFEKRDNNSGGFTGGYGGKNRRPEVQKLPPKPLMQIAVQSSPDMIPYGVQQQQKNQHQFKTGPNKMLKNSPKMPQQQQQQSQQQQLQQLMQEQMIQATGRFLPRGNKR